MMTDRVYFPPLEQCLTGEDTLLSWKHVADALSADSADRLTSPAVAKFLKDPFVHDLLKSPLKVFEPPSPRSKSEFETKTAAINVTPDPNDKYDIKTVKEDAQWLSQNAAINEVAALRVVAVAFHARAYSHMTGPLSTQDVVNLQEAAGVSSGQASVILGAIDTSAAVDAETIWVEFEKVESRRRRLLATYLSERRSFTTAADGLLTFLLHGQRTLASSASDALRRAILKDAFGFDEEADVNIAVFETLVPAYFELLPKCFEESQTVLQSVDSQVLTAELEADWIRTSLAEAIHSMTLAFQVLDTAGQLFANPDVVSQWFDFTARYGFLDQLQFADESVSELVLPLRSLVCVISLNLLNLTRSMAYLDQDVDLQVNEDPYLASPDLLGMIHNTVLDAANANLTTASPVIFAWSLILHRMYVAYQERAERRDLAQNQRAQDGFELENHPYNTGRRNSAGSIVSIEKSPYDIFLANSSLERDMQVVEQLAMAVTSRGLVYDLIADMAICMGSSQHAAFRPVVGPRARLVFLELLKASFPIAGYKSEPVSALLLTLSGGQQYWDISNDSPLPPEREVAALALNDPLLLEYYVYQSLHRYPYEFLPFTQMCRVFSSSLCSGEGSEIILNFLLKTPSLTFEFDKKWDNYELAQEVDNSNTIRLLRSEYLFTPSSPRRRPLSDEESFCIPAKTIGRFVTDGGKVVLLEYGHSTLALLGKRLEVNTTPDAYKPQPLGFLQPEETAEAINLLATLLRVSVLKAQGPTPEEVSGAGLKLLQEMSKALPRTKDIITVICDTLDNTIQGELADSEGADISVVTACLRFLHATLPLTPGRVWSYMARCELLNSESRAGRLSRITGNLDLLSERYDLLVSSVKLFSSLVSSARSSAVQRRIGTRPSSRQKIEEDPWLGTSDKIFSRICLSIAQTSVDIYENSATWRFASEVHRSIVVRDVVGTMNDLVTFSHSMGPPGEPKGLTGCLLPAAKYIIDTFLCPSSGTLRFQPLLASLLVAFQIPDTTLYPRREHIMTDRLVVVLRFATSLLRIADYLGLASQTIQKQLFKVASLVARLYAVRDAFRLPSLSLLGALVESAGKRSSEPPSLLGYLGPQISRSLIQILSILDKPLDRLTTTVGIWKFFSAIMRNRQQWMANCLLTGKTPREALEGNGRISKVHQDSVLHAALARLASISSIPSEETLAILDFFTSAQNYWPWTIFAMQKDNSFLDSLRSYVHDLKAPSIVSKSNPGEAAYQARIASYIAETFAMQLYHLRQMGREEIFARDVVNDLDYFLRDGVQVSGYNTSLHVNFSRNFASRYSGCSLEDFKTTILSPRNLGPQYYYALDQADAMLDFDASWIGPRRNGFRHEMETANLNLSLVDAQIALFHAWEYLLLELSVCLLPKNQKIPKQMLQVAEKCLESNQTSQAPEDIFVRITQSRANLSLTLLQRLADSSLLPKDFSQLLVTVSTTINGVENPFGPDQIHYTRTLLRILFVVLRGSAHSANSDAAAKSAGDTSVAVTQLVLNILDRVVAQGFRSLAMLVHESDSPTGPEDIALITAILQACLSIPGTEQCQTQILNIMASNDILHVATSLFSWADKLAEKGDPVYGELALLFLLELSALPAVAEQLACDGLLGHITSANLAGFMRRPNVTPFSDNAGASRCYGIWAKGVLPILLNMLSALGATVAPEVAFVLNQFPNLLRSSIDRFEAPGISRTVSRDAPQFVTLLAVSEVHSLALLTRVLGALRMNNSRDIPEVGWDGGPLLENIEFWLSSRKVLRERMLPLGSREGDWRATKAVEGSGCENMLEQKVVAQLEAVKDVLSEEME